MSWPWLLFQQRTRSGHDQSLVGVDGRLGEACEFAVGGLQELSQICHKVRLPTQDETKQRFDTRVCDFRGKLSPYNQQIQLDQH